MPHILDIHLVTCTGFACGLSSLSSLQISSGAISVFGHLIVDYWGGTVMWILYSTILVHYLPPERFLKEVLLLP